MVIILLAVFAILTFISWIKIENVPARVTSGLISGGLLLATVLMLVANFNNHFGMEKITKTETKTIYSAGGSKVPAGMMIAQALGTKSNNYVMIYADKENAKPTAHFVPNKKHIVEAVKKTATYKLIDADKATVTTKTTRWEWQNDFFKLMFGFGGEGHSLYKQQTVVKLPKDTWVVMTPAQSKAVQAKQKAAAANPAAAQAQQEQLKAAASAKIAAFMQVNPKASQDQVKAYTTKVTAELTAEAMKAMLK
ncbi:DUF4811 domain-containing protein [Weissella cibaria]|uniref:DUF4811 domain-containing protein n=1 Tax=Weissella cibaria TaxID=137591 RepID=UPI0013D98528|nr:DUF4811 domain-containing protein [Weissella cibaria]NFA03161.1 DUF4811 domain-containing protein [Weissella cibaria]